MPLTRHREINHRPRHVYGWKRDQPDKRDFMMSAHLPAMELPPTADLRALNPKVEDQEIIGSCTCNAATTVFEMAQRKGGIDVEMSRLWLYAKVREYEGVPLTEDSGAQIRSVVKVLASQGCPPEQDYPYDLSRWMASPPLSLDSVAAQHKATFYYKCDSLDMIKASLTQGFPVVFGFSCPANLFSEHASRTGEVLYPEPMEGFDGGHAVTAFGYHDFKKVGNEAGAICFLNSWGEGWGERGYGWLGYRFFKEGLATDAWTIRKVSL